jgi:hypothetical protein
MTDLVIKQNKAPAYLAIDKEGVEYSRDAKLVSELPTPEDRLQFLSAIKPKIEKLIGLSCEKLSFGIPLYESFKMSKKDARKHPANGLLFTQGCELKLSLSCI